MNGVMIGIQDIVKDCFNGDGSQKEPPKDGGGGKGKDKD